MRVVAMALLESARYLLAVVCLLLAWAAHWWPALVYVNAALLLAILYTLIVGIPLQLNWSRGMYGGLLSRFVVMVVFTVGIYAVHYHHGGLLRSGTPASSWVDALYFSVTTWTTLGYGDIVATGVLRLATSLEALTGLLTTAVLTALIWLYCTERLDPHAADRPKPRLTLEQDSVMGGFREIESEEVVHEREQRTRRLKLMPCKSCGGKPVMEKFFDIIGKLAPYPNFVVVCGCGEHSKYSKSAYLAALRWNRASK
jgi:hypothetical protein